MLQKYISRLTQTLSELGFDPDAMFETHGWVQGALDQLTGPQLQREQFKMIRMAREETGRSDLGALVGANMSLMDFGPLGMLVASSSTGRVAFHRVIQFLSIAEILWSAEYDLEGDAPYLEVTYQDSVPSDLHEYFLDEFAAAWGQFSNEIMHVDGWALSYHQTGELSVEREQRSQTLGIPFIYGSPKYRFDLNPALLDAPIANANPVIAAVLEQQCELIVKGMPNAHSEVEKIRRFVLDHMPEIPSVAEIASGLNTSERTLRRICARNDTTARDIILDVRLSMACNHLRNSTMTVNEISYLVGYSSPSSFFHAFREWSGTSPSEFRATEADFAKRA